MKVYRAKPAPVVLLTGLLVMISSASIFGQNMFRKINDFDGDGKADYAVTRNVDGYKYWYVWQSTAGFKVFQWGIATDTETAGDYDGDGKTDFAVYRVAPDYGQATFYIHRSSTNTSFYNTLGTVQPRVFIQPLHQDYDGDGKADTTHYYQYNNSFDRSIMVIESHDETIPRPIRYFLVEAGLVTQRLGDLTGDGQAEIVKLNPSNNNLTVINYVNNAVQNVQFGISGDVFVPGDFDGDGKGDIAIFRPSTGTWWWRRSSDNALYAAQWGTTGDVPVPADYDGDGKTDLAIWRDGNYWVFGSQIGSQVFNWGIPSDKPIAY